MILLGINNSPAIPIKHKILTRNSLSCFIFAHPSSLESFHRMYLALNTRIASHGCKSEIVYSCFRGCRYCNAGKVVEMEN